MKKTIIAIGAILIVAFAAGSSFAWTFDNHSRKNHWHGQSYTAYSNCSYKYNPIKKRIIHKKAKIAKSGQYLTPYYHYYSKKTAYRHHNWHGRTDDSRKYPRMNGTW